MILRITIFPKNVSTLQKFFGNSFDNATVFSK